MSDLQPFLGPTSETAKVGAPTIYFYPDVLVAHLAKSCSGNQLVNFHMRIIDEAARMEHKTRTTVQERQVKNPLLQSMAIQNIPGFSIFTGESGPKTTHPLFPLDIISALKQVLLLNSQRHVQLMRSFGAIEEHFVDQIVNVCALSQGSDDWCSFIALRREDWDVNDHIDWEALCDKASKGIEPDQHVEPEGSSECDARFARIVQSLLMEFGAIAFAAFFRLQDRKYHYYRVVLPLQRYRLEARNLFM